MGCMRCMKCRPRGLSWPVFLIGHWSRDFWANLFFHPHIIPTGINKGASTCGLPAPKTAKWPVVPLPSGCHRSLVHSDAVICRYGSHLCRYGLQSVPGASWCKRAWIRAMTDACFLFRPQIHKLNRNWIGGFLWRFRGFTWFYGFTLFHPLAHLHIFIFLLKHIFLGGQCLQKNTTSPRLQIPMVGLPGMTLPMVAILAMDATASPTTIKTKIHRKLSVWWFSTCLSSPQKTVPHQVKTSGSHQLKLMFHIVSPVIGSRPPGHRPSRWPPRTSFPALCGAHRPRTKPWSASVFSGIW